MNESFFEIPGDAVCGVTMVAKALTYDAMQRRAADEARRALAKVAIAPGSRVVGMRATRHFLLM